MKRTLAATLLLSACSSEDSTAPGAGGAFIDYKNCEEQTALVLLPSALMPPLPAGFAYITPAGEIGVAAIHISGATCASVDGGGPEQNMLAFALVQPPDEYVVPEVATYAVALGGYSNRPETAAAFDSWGLTGLMQLAAVQVQLTELPALRIGQVSAQANGSSLTTRINAVGPATVAEPGGGHTRAFFAPGGVLKASLDAVYTEQQAHIGVGTVTQTGAGPIPLPVSAATGSHAFGYDLKVGFVQRYD